MKILVTGAKGFIGKNFTEHLKNIRDGKFQNTGIEVADVFCADVDTTMEEWERFCRETDFVFHFAGVNRPEKDEEFLIGNRGSLAMVLDLLERYDNRCPVMLSSSIQATLSGRFTDSAYGKSKLAAEELLAAYGKRLGVKTLIYRFPNTFGKWARPSYNSVVATFCHAIANDLPYHVDDPAITLELTYIDDLMEEMLRAIRGQEYRCSFEDAHAVPDENGLYCTVPLRYHVTLGEIEALLLGFKDMQASLFLPALPPDSFEKKLFSMYLSYLPAEKSCYALSPKVDDRGSFTEIIKTLDHGQFSVNVSKPGITKGEHWHDSKWEIFVVVSGHGLIQMRKIGTEDIREYEVSGDVPQAVIMLPGYTHNIINLSETENLVTLMWANEIFDTKRPDTYSEKVK